MMSFATFLEQSEEEKDIKNMLSKLPPNHARLIQGFHWNFQPGNVLKGDSGHIGMVDMMNKTITLASPWNYGKEFAALHEIGHQVWASILPDKMKKVWVNIVKKTADRLPDDIRSQSPEEIFCMAYSQFYTKNKLQKYNQPEWMAFIKTIPG